MQCHQYGPLTLFPLFICLYRSCLSQRSGVFGLCVLLSPHLYISPAPRACCGHGTVQGGVRGGLWVSARPLPSPGTLSKKRRLSLFPSETHLPVRGQDTAEMQHLVWLFVSFQSLFFLYTSLSPIPVVPFLALHPFFLIWLLNLSVCAEQASGSVLGRSAQPSAAWWGRYRLPPLTRSGIYCREETAPSLLWRWDT